MLVHPNDTSHHSTIILKMRMPERIGQHNIRSTVRAMFIRRMEEMAKIRLKPQRIEVIPTGLLNPRAGWAIARIQARQIDVIGDQAVKAVVAVAQIEIVRI